MDDPTACPTCHTTCAECAESHAMGHDGCCMQCDELGHSANHHHRAPNA
jgi:hypothetical protein